VCRANKNWNMILYSLTIIAFFKVQEMSIIIPNENMIKVKISSQEDTSPIKCPENDKVII